MASAGMASLRAMLEHANRYGLKYIFVHDPYYEPLLTFVGWRKIETFNNGDITAWSKDDVPPAHRDLVGCDPRALEGLLWGTLADRSQFPGDFSWSSCCRAEQQSAQPVAIPSPCREREGHYVA